MKEEYKKCMKFYAKHFVRKLCFPTEEEIKESEEDSQKAMVRSLMYSDNDFIKMVKNELNKQEGKNEKN